MSLHITMVKPRLHAIDFLRGIVLILMALDHTRDFFHNGSNPLDLSHTTGALFFTRWITHYCAPVFIFLSGMSAYLYASRPGRSLKQTSRFLLSRGVWLMFTAFTIVYAGWTFFLTPYEVIIEVFFVIGASMMILSFLIYLPRWLIAVLSLSVIFLHNLLDGWTVADFSYFAPVWMVLHQKGGFTLNQIHFFVIYPLIPWFAVMAAGYALAPVLNFPEKKRCQIFFSLGVICTFLFIVLRWLNGYGDSQPWAMQKEFAFTIMSFLNCTKYPPSLLYLLMTLGPALIALSLFKENYAQFSICKKVMVFGSTPFFFYMLHVPLIQALSLLMAYVYGGAQMVQQAISDRHVIGYDLPVVYAVWFLVLIVLYYPCLYLSQIKSRHRYWLLSYI